MIARLNALIDANLNGQENTMKIAAEITADNAELNGQDITVNNVFDIIPDNVIISSLSNPFRIRTMYMNEMDGYDYRMFAYVTPPNVYDYSLEMPLFPHTYRGNNSAVETYVEKLKAEWAAIVAPQIRALINEHIPHEIAVTVERESLAWDSHINVMANGQYLFTHYSNDTTALDVSARMVENYWPIIREQIAVYGATNAEPFLPPWFGEQTVTIIRSIITAIGRRLGDDVFPQLNGILSHQLGYIVEGWQHAFHNAYTERIKCAGCGVENGCFCDGITAPKCDNCGAWLRAVHNVRYAYCTCGRDYPRSTPSQIAVNQWFAHRGGTHGTISDELRETLPFDSWVGYAFCAGLLNTAAGDYFDIADSYAHITYLPANKIDRIDASETVWNSRLRVSMKIGRALRQFAVLPWSAIDSDIERATNAVKSSNPALINDRITIVYGEDIRDSYHEDNYAKDGIGTMANSCMRYSRCQTYLDIYVENPDVCGLATLRNDDGEMLARALVWTGINGVRFIDRIYGTDAIENAFEKWAENNGISRSAHDVQLKTWDFCEWPYMDTLRYIDPTNGRLSAYSRSSYCESLCSTDGDGPNGAHNAYVCDGCGYTCDEDEIYFENDGNYCGECHAARSCADCESYVGATNDDIVLCSDCIDNRTCTQCGDVDLSYDHSSHNNSRFGELCDECMASMTCIECGILTDVEMRAGLCEYCHGMRVHGAVSDDVADEWRDSRRTTLAQWHAARHASVYALPRQMTMHGVEWFHWREYRGTR